MFSSSWTVAPNLLPNPFINLDSITTIPQSDAKASMVVYLKEAEIRRLITARSTRTRESRLPQDEQCFILRSATLKFFFFHSFKISSIIDNGLCLCYELEHTRYKQPRGRQFNQFTGHISKMTASLTKRKQPIPQKSGNV